MQIILFFFWVKSGMQYLYFFFFSSFFKEQVLFLITFNFNLYCIFNIFHNLFLKLFFFLSCLYFDSRSSVFEKLLFSFYFWTVCVFLNSLSSLENLEISLLLFQGKKECTAFVLEVYMGIVFCIRFAMGMTISSQIFRPPNFPLFTDLDQIHPWLLKTNRIWLICCLAII